MTLPEGKISERAARTAFWKGGIHRIGHFERKKRGKKERKIKGLEAGFWPQTE